MEGIFLGAGLGFFLGILPGAYLTLVVTTALERGRREAITVALLPLGTETFVLLAAALVLTGLPEDALRWIGVAGGALLVYMAFRIVRQARTEEGGPDEGEGESDEEDDGSGGHYTRVALLGVISPNPWVFWLLLGAPLLLSQWRQGPLYGIGFAAGYLAFFVGAMVGVAWTAAASRKFVEGGGKRWILYGAGVLLAGAGAVVFWQSWTGNFQEFASAPEEILNWLR